MQSTLFWIATPVPGRLATMARPRGGDWLAGDLGALRELGVDKLVSLLTVEEQIELELGAEPDLARAAGLGFRSFPIPDYSVPRLDADTVAVIDQLAADVQVGQAIALHCRMGIGRSSLIAASVLTALGLSSSEAFARISTARGRPVPDTNEQRQWVEGLVAARARLRSPGDDAA
jgi:protein-tyrosine phosphatase